MAGPAWLTGPHTPPPRRGDMAKAARSYRSRELRGRTYASCAAAGPGRDRVWSVARLPQSAVPQRTAPSPRRARARARGAEPACMAEPPRSWLLWLARFAARAQLVCLLSRALSLSRVERDSLAAVWLGGGREGGGGTCRRPTRAARLQLLSRSRARARPSRTIPLFPPARCLPDRQVGPRNLRTPPVILLGGISRCIFRVVASARRPSVSRPHVLAPRARARTTTPETHWHDGTQRGGIRGPVGCVRGEKRIGGFKSLGGTGMAAG